jgi:hypothetical protein
VAMMAAKLLTGNTNDDGTPNAAADLDFSAYDQTYSVANIVASWSNAGGSGIYYPLIDYGNYSVDKHSWKYGTFRPALYVKEYIDKIFAKAGYTYDCDLFNTTRFKKLIVPHNQKDLTRNTYTVLDVESSSQFQKLVAGFGALINLPNDIVLGLFTATSSATYTYNNTASLAGTIFYKISGNLTSIAGSGGFSVGVFLNGSPIFSQVYPTAPSNIIIEDEIDGVTLNNGDYLELRIFNNYQSFDFTHTCYLKFNSVVKQKVNVFFGENIQISDTVPKNITQVDFISSIIKLFQLYVYEDPNIDKHLLITPFVDMFNSSVTQDWSKKLDRSKPYKLKPLSELNARYYEFKHKSDSDYYNDLYKKAYNLEYGSFRYDSSYQFSQEFITVDIIFSGTPLVGYVGEEKVYSTIFKRTGNSSPYVEESVDSNIRILQTKLVTGVASWNILAADGTTVLGSYTNYPYAGHFDDPDAPSNDINFGLPNELYFVLLAGDLSVNQFNVYWSTYMREITDKDAKMLTAKFNLSFKDIANLKFGNYINIDGNLFRINKIGDFNITKSDLCECELIKVNNLINF